jgi:AcrR family transcriptional regulator
MLQREKVIEQAAMMFAEQGIKSIRMDDIAHALAMSKRTLYEMFEDKEELLYLSITYMRRRRMAAVEARLKENGDSLAELFESFDLMTVNRELHRRISNNLQKFYPRVFERVKREAEEENGRALYSLINHYVECGLIMPTVDVRLSVTILYYTITTLITSVDNKSFSNNVTLEDALQYTIVNFFRGIATIKGVKQIDDYLNSKQR